MQNFAGTPVLQPVRNPNQGKPVPTDSKASDPLGKLKSANGHSRKLTASEGGQPTDDQTKKTKPTGARRMSGAMRSDPNATTVDTADKEQKEQVEYQT